ncbi:hypothetical protein J8L98_05480 [Pseudoalteromonas sp. MMG013]|uniref:hypothetical protein n=1 Tax=Pseudoalteromonas sp. MMG013 TaxID=2822687 RepID=UPI001B399F79|nr:hypothetical protein [Pseudoalteromonas sp. MMG013]MBQ4861139.1 hypothetical protein [Pseudoalteromonas sp. MMG013]
MEISSHQLNLLCGALAQLRLQADLILAPKYPTFAGKPYPLGRCKEIRDEVYLLLKDQSSYNNHPVLNLLKTQEQAYPNIKKVWGSLRDEYFQNAMIIEQWYIDVANDTVDANKPRVEMVLSSHAGFGPITSFTQFANIARPYWQVDLYRNDVCPALAPFLPIVCVGKNNVSWLAAANDDMLNLAMQSEFKASEDILNNLPQLPMNIRNKWQALLTKHAATQLLTSEGQAVTFCQKYRAQSLHLDLSFRDNIVIAYSQLPKGV